MWVEIIAVCVGLFTGAAGMYWLQRRERRQELKRLEGLTEDILNERRIMASASGKETLYGKTEHELIRVQEMLKGQKDVAERSRDEIQKLISEIAHQMRIPLMNLGTYLEFLRENPTEESMEAVADSTEKLQFLVESFIKMSRLEQHIIQIRKEEPDILQTVRNALGQIQNQAEKKGIRFKITLPEKVVCMHDANWLGEAVYNVLDNAVKYSENGEEIEVSVLESEMFLKIRIRDCGIGIEKGEEYQIFKRFYRGVRVTVQEGFGIGLYLAGEIVNRHGGFLKAKRMKPGLMLEINLPLNLLEVC